MSEEQASEKTGWTCARCKAENSPDFTNCRMCGEPGPLSQGLKTCAKCGHSTSESCCPLCNSTLFLQL